MHDVDPVLARDEQRMRTSSLAEEPVSFPLARGTMTARIAERSDSVAIDARPDGANLDAEEQIVINGKRIQECDGAAMETEPSFLRLDHVQRRMTRMKSPDEPQIQCQHPARQYIRCRRGDV
jgi:hypothetical protein